MQFIVPYNTHICKLFVNPRDFFFFAILGRSPRAFQIGRISEVNP